MVALLPYMDGKWLEDLNDFCALRDLRWTQFHLEGSKGWLGPFVVPERTADYADVLCKRCYSGDHVEASCPYPPQSSEGILDRSSVDTAALRWMLSRFFTEIEQALNEQGQMLSVELEADPQTQTCTPHHILPLPTKVADPFETHTGTTLNQSMVDPHPISMPVHLLTPKWLLVRH